MDGELARIEEALRASVTVDDPHLTEIALHLITAGGKRQRPALTVLASGGVPSSEEAVLGGVAVELVQVGSLCHDDVMDEADTRRGVETVNHRWGNLRAILAGDFLLAKASEIAAGLGTEVAGLLAATIGRLCEGQVLELQTTFQPDRTEDAYLRAIDGKTAALFAAATRIGGIVSSLPAEQIEALTLYGHRYGMAFQVVDDVLDVVATDEQLGKPAGNDLAVGVYTFPVIRGLAAGDEELAELLGRPLEAEEVDRARKLVRAGSGIDESLELAAGYGEQAVAALAPLPPSPAVDTLAAAARALVTSVPDTP
jgi:heptaprenyl diphosphate synthase